MGGKLLGGVGLDSAGMSYCTSTAREPKFCCIACWSPENIRISLGQHHQSMKLLVLVAGFLALSDMPQPKQECIPTGM